MLKQPQSETLVCLIGELMAPTCPLEVLEETLPRPSVHRNKARAANSEECHHEAKLRS